MSKYDGDFSFELKGKKLTICYDWLALAALSDFDDAVKEIAKPIDTINPLRIAEVLFCGLRKHHPEIGIDDIVEWSPPLMRVVMIIDKALSYSYFGADGVPVDKKKLNPTKKKTIFQRLFE